MIGSVGVGGAHPVRVQSMTTSDTQDIDATVRQSIALAEVGCEIVRITAPNVPAARCLREIRTRFNAAGFGHVPLVADIHFLPSAAMEAVEHVEKVRVNPGNYADKKRFAVREYTDADYRRELERLHESFSPLVRRCRELGRAMRIGTNHGSLSDRIMNRYGDTPEGMVESALEFLRIARDNGFHDMVLSMKASNPKVVIQAYRLLVERMAAEDMHYPLHLGVTEAGDGEDGRIKSAIGIGSLLFDGLGDTIRVSLTEDSVYEIPVAQAIVRKAMSLWRENASPVSLGTERDDLDPYHFQRRSIRPVELAPGTRVASDQPPRVLVRAAEGTHDLADIAQALRKARATMKETPLEGLLVQVEGAAAASHLLASAAVHADVVGLLVLERSPAWDAETIAGLPSVSTVPRIGFLGEFAPADATSVRDFIRACAARGATPFVSLTPEAVAPLARALDGDDTPAWIATLSTGTQPEDEHAIGTWRRLVDALKRHDLRVPLWIRNTRETAVAHEPAFLSRLLEASILTGALLCDGIGDLVSVETEPDLVRSTRLAYNVLQGAGARISKTEFVACPSCGRTLFDLQTTTQRIREKTGHLKGVKIAIMGCIVNGPGEMADADFGYVGGAPGRINLYVGKNCVQYNIPQAEADQRLIDLIREHGKWLDPDPIPEEPAPV
ncbi:(E)-4-hydroxy-3-methylbut-2-enyl-diphosphate synthase [Congregicoccus parvus]|uniref:(E)-4-hydroxy-3-methylbut-2-enyl-diphosphate synthase n=1 Tax=Congregicoccus parvus TaxID=3081749 RepID=UPI003FA56B1A